MRLKTSLLVALCASFLLPACSGVYEYDEATGTVGAPVVGSSSAPASGSVANSTQGSYSTTTTTTAVKTDAGSKADDAIYQQRGMEISSITSRMADTLQQNMFYHLLPDAPVDRTATADNVKIVTMPRIAITSFVDTDTYENSGYLGRALAEFFTHEMSSRAFDVTEYKLTGKLSVSKDGDYILSRNWRKIAKDTNVKYLLGGTLTRNDKGVVVVARIINMQTRQSIATATDFIPYNLLPSCYRTASKNCSFAGVSGYLNPTQIRVANYYQTPEQQNRSRLEALQPRPVSGSSVNTSKGFKAQVVSASGKPLGGVFVAATPETNQPSAVQQSDSFFAGDEQVKDPRFYDGIVVGATSRGNYDRYREQVENQGTFGRCTFGDCNDPVVYPANTYMHNTLLIRDTADESAYGRVSN